MLQPKLELEAYSGALLGARSKQEDASRIWQSAGRGNGREAEIVMLVADGLGGHVSGDVASATTCDAFLETFEASSGSAGERMVRALTAGHERLREAIAAAPGRDSMGTTLLAVHVDEHGLSWLSVGDSILMLYRGGKITRLNEDHSLGSILDRQAEAGIISAADARDNPKRNALRSAVASGPIALVDASKAPMVLAAGDWVVLASDGLLTLEPEHQLDVVRRHATDGAKAMVTALLAAVEACEQPGQDNTTVVALAVHAGPTTRLVKPMANSAHALSTGSEVTSGARRGWVLGLLAATAAAAVAAAVLLRTGELAPQPPSAPPAVPRKAAEPTSPKPAEQMSPKPAEPQPSTPKVQP